MQLNVLESMYRDLGEYWGRRDGLDERGQDIVDSLVESVFADIRNVRFGDVFAPAARMPVSCKCGETHFSWVRLNDNERRLLNRLMVNKAQHAESYPLYDSEEDVYPVESCQ